MLEINGLCRHYNDFTLNCSVKVDDGRVTGLVGENGAGKSTTFKAILGLISYDGGNVRLWDKTPAELMPEDRERMGIVLSDAGYSTYLTVKDIVRIQQAMYSRFDKEKFLEKCQKFKIPLNKQIKGFSTGMKAKVKILTAISHEAEFLLLDEPTSGLDVMARESVLNMLREYMEEDESRSILISSHISTDLEGLCDDIYMIHNGKIILHEDTDVLMGEYGLLKVSDEQYQKLDKEHLLKIKRENYGYACLTNQKQYYRENYPEIVIENGNLDEAITMMIGGENL